MCAWSFLGMGSEAQVMPASGAELLLNERWPSASAQPTKGTLEGRWGACLDHDVELSQPAPTLPPPTFQRYVSPGGDIQSRLAFRPPADQGLGVTCVKICTLDSQRKKTQKPP